MTITAASISGGFPDPDASGEEPAGSTLNAVNEYSEFEDRISVDLLVPEGSPYLSLDNLTATVTVNGTPIESNELTGNGNVSLNVTYEQPNTTSVTGLTVVVTINGDNTAGNVSITGNIQGAFPDQFWEYKDFSNNTTSIVSGVINIPDADVGLFTFKPSFMRYVNIVFNVNAEYDSGNVAFTVPKKVVNSWEINRLAVISQVDREESYRSNNYPGV